MANKLVQLKENSDNIFPLSIFNRTLYNVNDLDSLDENCFFSAYNTSIGGNGWIIGINLTLSTENGNPNKDYKAQIVLNIYTNRFLTRCLWNKSWSTWKELT